MSAKYLDKIYTNLQNKVAEREPFNEDLINFRYNEDVEYFLTGILKGLQVIKGVEFLGCEIRKPSDLYESKKDISELTKDELAILQKKTSTKKGIKKSTYSPYPTTPIKESRLLECIIRMRYTDETRSEEFEYKLLYPELINGRYFYLQGNRFFPVFQLADAEFYRAGRNSVVLKTTFMPVAIKGETNELLDSTGRLIHKNARNFEVSLFTKNINMFAYYFAKYDPLKSADFFGFGDSVEFIYEKLDKYLSANDINVKKDPDVDYYFKISNSLAIKVKRDYLNPEVSDFRYRCGLIYTYVTAFKRKHVNQESIVNLDYWMRQLGKQFTTNTSKTYEKAVSITLSIERLLDETTRDLMRYPTDNIKSIYEVIRLMTSKFDELIIMNNHDIANKRIRVAEYLLVPLTMRLSNSVYRLIGLANPSVDKLKQLFSSIDEEYLINQIHSINLVRYSSNVNSLDLFSSVLKASKQGPQSQKSDNSSNSIAIRGIDKSHIGSIDIISTSSGDPGMSCTITPFCKIHDPNKKGHFYFADKPHVTLEVEKNEFEDLELEEE